MLNGIDGIIPQWLTTKKKMDHKNEGDIEYSLLPQQVDQGRSTPPYYKIIRRRRHYGWVLPVIWMEFMAISLTRAIIPPLLVQYLDNDNNIYWIMGCVECIRGAFAFLSCPLMGQWSDVIGRRPCLFVAVLGTCSPLLLQFMFLLLTDWTTKTRMILFVISLAISGIFCTTFTLTFAYIADTTSTKDNNDHHHITPYGFALATFGFAFTIGPMMGAYLKEERYVFGTSFLFLLIDLLYIAFILPESKPNTTSSKRSNESNNNKNTIVLPWDIVSSSKLVWTVGMVSFYYYIALWGVLSTLTLYVTQRFHMTSQELGHLLSLLGLCTMLSEAILVQYIQPGYEYRAIQLGLTSFTLQCILLGCAYQKWHLYPCILLSIFGNLVYPSLTSLIVYSSSHYDHHDVGQLLGAIHGIKALTEGIGPLCFGLIFSFSNHNHHHFTGWPYFLLSIFPMLALYQCQYLQYETNDNDCIDKKIIIHKRTNNNNNNGSQYYEEEQEMINLLSSSSFSSTES